MTQRVRIFAVAGLVAVLALGGGFLLLGRGQSSTPAAVKQVKPLHPVKKHVRKAAAKPARTVHKTTHAVPKKAEKAKKKPVPAVIDGMPSAVALALRSAPVVVVSLYAPGSDVDRLATAEAQEGAKLAGAAFVTLDVTSEKVAAPLTSLLTGGATPADRVLDDPAVLIFQSPKTLYVRFNGWTDRDTVAQAAENAASTQ